MDKIGKGSVKCIQELKTVKRSEEEIPQRPFRYISSESRIKNGKNIFQPINDLFAPVHESQGLLSGSQTG